MKSLLLSYAEDLNDAYPGYEFSIWSQSQLLGFFNEALCLIAAQRPDMFTELKIIKVDPCSSYLDLCDCVKVLDVLGQSDKYGKNVRPLIRRKEKNTVWTGVHRRNTFSKNITDYEITNGNMVQVFPPNLDPTIDIYLLVRCSIEPKTYTVDDAAPSERCAFMAAARHWVMYNAKMMDGEFSQAMANAAKDHREMFTAILQLVKQGDDSVDKDKKSTKK